MKRPNLILATPYPYTTAIIAIIWLGGVILLNMHIGLNLNEVIITDSVMSLLLATVGFRD